MRGMDDNSLNTSTESHRPGNLYRTHEQGQIFLQTSTSEMTSDNYQDLGDCYDSLEELPLLHVAREMVQSALGDCTGKVILDLGGGSGLRAREALALGARRVDNVDLSGAMIARCENEEQRLGRQPRERIVCYQANCFEDLGPLSLPGAGERIAGDKGAEAQYDIVMVIWTFDHASTVEELEEGWRNVGRFCRPGGKVVSLGIKEPLSHGTRLFKYGVELSDVQKMDGGAKFKYSAKSTRPFSCDVVAIEAHYNVDRTRAIAAIVGFPLLEEVRPSEMEVVKKDREFWKTFVDQPSFYCLVGTKEESP